MLLSDEEKEEEEVTVLVAADSTPPVNELHSSKPEPFPHAQRAPLDLVDKEPSRIVETGQDSPNENGVFVCV